MKKSIITIAAFAMVLASCSDNETLREAVSTENVPFTFAAYSNKATKGTDNHNNLEFFYTTFKVNGWKSYDGTTWTNVFDDETNEYFETNANGQSIYTSSLPGTEWGNAQGNPNFPGWYYEGIRYWDKFATNYQFCAYAPITASNKVVCKPSGVITIGDDGVATAELTAPKGTIAVETTNLMATPKKALAYKGFSYDYMTAKLATNSNSPSTNVSPVQLVFAHELAKFNIKIQLNDKVTTTQTVTVNEVSIKNIYGTSYYTSEEDVAAPTAGFLSGWATPTGIMDYTVNGVSAAGYQINKDLDETDAEFDNYSGYFIMERLMVPQTITKTDPASQHDAFAGTNASVYVKYTIGTEEYEGYWGLANLFDATTNNTVNLLGGNEYTLTITVGPEPIYFTANVSTWDENLGSFEF